MAAPSGDLQIFPKQTNSTLTFFIGCKNAQIFNSSNGHQRATLTVDYYN